MLKAEIEKKLRNDLKKPHEIEAGYRSLIMEFQNTDIVDKDVKKYIENMCSKLGTLAVSQSFERNFEQWYFRARAATGFNCKDASQFSHPPRGIPDRGRCNLKGEPVFYGSELPKIAFDEIHCEIGDLVYLSLWRSRDNYPTYAKIPISYPAKTARFSVYSQRQEDQFREFLESLPFDLRDSFIAHRNIQQRMYRDTDSHCLSAIHSHHIFNSSEVDGIEYPDAKSGICYNFALSESFARKIEIHRVYLVEIKPNYEWQYIKFGTPDGHGNVEWRDPLCSDDPLKMSKDSELTGIFSDIMASNWIPPT